MAETKDLIRGGSFLINAGSPDDVFVLEEITDEQKLIAQTTEDFINNEVRPHMEELEQQNFELSVSLLKKAGELGLLAADVPEKYGGVSLDKISSALIGEKFALGRGFAITFGAHVGIGSLPIVYFGTEEQKQRYLPDLATGKRIAAYCLTEPGSGSDALGAKTTAKLSEDGTHYVLNGTKQFITNAGFADIFIVYAKIDGEHFSAFIVERDFPGVSVGAEEKKMGIKCSSTRPLILEDARVPVENLLGEPGRGHVIAFNILNVGRYKLAVGAVGSAKHALHLATTYAKERKQFKTPIANFSIIKNKLGTMAAKIYAAESLVYRTVGLFDAALSALGEKAEDGREVAKAIAEYAIECSINKVFASEVLDYCVDEGVQIHGGYGYIQEYEIEGMYRDSRINRIFEGTNEINRLLIPDMLVKKAMKGELPLMQAAAGLQEELMSYYPEEIEEAPLAAEKHLIEMTRKIILMVAGSALMKYQQAIAKEQELLALAADMLIELYAMDSVVKRTEKAIEKNGVENERQKLDLATLYVHEAFDRIEGWAKEALAAMEEGDELRMRLSILKKLTRRTPINTVHLKRAIADRVIEADGYVL
ncbi:MULTISPECIES: acyl-CoA dehydrogenase family protein [Bacillales]|jgi:alkylation response protein AidB-like acyl-CoA dehydrogenase|uniref:Acyl-CoA dehydrogenase n=1 Tax=Brevibacillus aydinogluensis TaxID=927786 RepID=A0AA48RCW1_9BACL|nr:MULTISPECIES: acyl-CoA dehydrogenase family protein [Bacillales]REK63734.1 MAG: acyl-CoA dehydrogenase [Brevibacillus sp.]MBR8660511.1 acyl-CoA dehydrogenase family protein [Brevibacillus sp. NL20B1]MDT3415793.1 alkylation response protein AidB-like acyl-CoA dehydrogenase [Brevibacillus aydinogluensis]NNV03871.1 acyl-CoA dehydrogenase [Brevibacillus sp. MCWH]UFJ61745.1 acyl-CoA dehydrogenase family protein [Anoxybacillus sediminis]